MYKTIEKCRLCGSKNLKTVLDLGKLSLTGVFPNNTERVEEGPLEMVKCMGGCGLVQLHHSFEPEKMYGDNYGYRSGLNISMVNHLHGIVQEIEERISLTSDDLVIDIGSNDGTLLSQYSDRSLDFLGMDPTGNKFYKYYRNDIELCPSFFSYDNVKKIRKDKKAKVVTSIAMFYDLEDPIQFARDIESVLDVNGIWVFEQSYFPFMLETNSYDTVCHEHLEFYSLKQIKYILGEANLRAISVKTNGANGGSFRIIAAKNNSDFEIDGSVDKLENYELLGKYDDLKVLEDFSERIKENKKRIIDFFDDCKKNGKVVLGYGASTKGNVMLQYCNIDSKMMPMIADVNEDKYGKVTPGTKIPIVSEDEARKKRPDYFMVLPWHFKNGILDKEKEYMRKNGVGFVFCFPTLEVIYYEDIK